MRKAVGSRLTLFGVFEVETTLDEEEEAIRDKLSKEPILGDFAQFLIDTDLYDWLTLEDLLLKEWDGAIPTSVLGDDPLDDIASFIYYLNEYCLGKVVGEENRNKYKIAVWPSYDGYSIAVIYNRESRTLMSEWMMKTWYFNPARMEEEILELQKQISEGAELVKRRMELGV